MKNPEWHEQVSIASFKHVQVIGSRRVTNTLVSSCSVALAAFCIWILGNVSAKAHYAMVPIEKVPIQRLLTKFEGQLKEGTNTVQATYTLARIHSMIYATNSSSLDYSTGYGTVQFAWPGGDTGVPKKVNEVADPEKSTVRTAHLRLAINHYEDAIKLLRREKSEKDRWIVLPLHLGYAWCLDQAGRRSDALKAYQETLDIAWQREVVGDFELKDWLSDRWEDIKARRNPLKGSRRGGLGPGVVFANETIRYMLPLLDPAEDEERIEDLKNRQKQLMLMPRAITPIVVPLGAETDLVSLTNPTAGVPFDLDGTGLKRRWGWIRPNAAWLVYRSRPDERITSGLQMFGNVTFWIFWENGYQALSSLDDDGDGYLKGTELHNLALWQDLDGDGRSVAGEVKNVVQWGITALSTHHDQDESGQPWNPRGVLFGTDEWRPTYDWIVPSNPVVIEDEFSGR